MANVFLLSDTHFGHEACCTKFKKSDGITPLRPYANAEEMNDKLIKNWNSVVGVNDKVYHLGDVVINKKYLPILHCLNGNKRLIRGNHDIFDTQTYLTYFKEIYGVRVLSDMILSHIPLRKECITSRFQTNVHGHLHDNDINDGAYFSVCVEKIDFTPISLDVLRERIIEKKKKFGDYNPVVKLNEYTGGVD